MVWKVIPSCYIYDEVCEMSSEVKGRLPAGCHCGVHVGTAQQGFKRSHV